jgi:DNA-binding MarR family transcriptional regulator
MFPINKDHFVLFADSISLTYRKFAIMANVDLASGFTLSSDLADQYLRLSASHQQFFLKLFRQIFNYLLPATRLTSHGGVLFTYYLVNQSRKDFGLSVGDLDLLTLIYHLSAGGRETLRTDKLREIHPNISSRHFVSLRKKGFIQRHTWDPLIPAYRSQRSHRPIFLRITPAGITIIEEVEIKLRKLLYRSTIANATTAASTFQHSTTSYPRNSC